MRCSSRFVLAAGMMLAGIAVASADAETTVRIASFNVHGPAFTPAFVAPTAAAIRASGADVVGLQEGSGNVAAVVAALGPGWTYRQFANHGDRDEAANTDTAILSRLPISQTLNGGVRVEVAPGREAYVFSEHAPAWPYQPYDLRDGKVTTAAGAVAAAEEARGDNVDALIAQVSPYVAAGRATFVTGDFNEPSHLDWTPAAAAAGLHPFAVAYPASRKLADAGFGDSYRALHPDEVAKPGDTWTPEPGPNEVFDRLDYVYSAGTGVTAKSVKLVGENAINADVVSEGFPSDHRLVVATFALPDAATLPLRTGVNLLSNPGAEANNAAGRGANRTVVDWETADSDTRATAQLRGVGRPGDYQPASPPAGKAYFYGGADCDGAETHAITQTVGLAELASEIDTGRARFALCGDFGGYAEQNDAASLTVTFLGESGAAVESVTIGGVTAADRQNVTRLLSRRAAGDVPERTRVVRFTLTFTKEVAGTSNDGSADNLSFVVSLGP